MALLSHLTLGHMSYQIRALFFLSIEASVALASIGCVHIQMYELSIVFRHDNIPRLIESST